MAFVESEVVELKAEVVGDICKEVIAFANTKGGTLYIGVTSDLARRAFEHRSGAVDGFTKRYRLKLLVWTEWHDDIRRAIQREEL